jgi:hypothetical protein
MTAKYTVIDSQVLTTSAASVTFSSIPGGYKDLVLVVSPIVASYPNWIGLRFNGDTANYNYVYMSGDGSTAASATAISQSQIAIIGQMQSGQVGSYIFQIQDFSITDKHKSVIARGGYASGAGTPRTNATAGRWANTAAISSLTLINDFGVSYDTGSTFRLLGVN